MKIDKQKEIRVMNKVEFESLKKKIEEFERLSEIKEIREKQIENLTKVS